MGVTTGIEWCDSTLNLQMGCDGCELWNPRAGVRECYAGVLTERYAGVSAGFPASFAEPRLFPERLKQALRWPDLSGCSRPDKPWLDGRPRIVFLDDMGDTFTEGLPIDWLAEHLPAMAASPHQWLLLTKRPRRALEFASMHPFPENFWLGTSITSRASLSRIDWLLQIPARVRFLSVEPIKESIDLALRNWADLCPLHWVIVGGPSGAEAAPVHPDWVRLIRDDCQEAGVPFFFKQWGEWLPITEVVGAETFYVSNKRAGPHQDQASIDDSFGRRCRFATRMIQFDGVTGCYSVGGHLPYQVFRTGKHTAGRKLGGRLWSGLPIGEGGAR